MTTTNNQERRERAAEAVRQYVAAKGEKLEESPEEVVDLMTDLLHLIAWREKGKGVVGVMKRALETARMNLEAER